MLCATRHRLRHENFVAKQRHGPCFIAECRDDDRRPWPTAEQRYARIGARRARDVDLGAIQDLPGRMIEIAKTVGLNPKGEDRKQQMSRQMERRRSPDKALPSCAQACEIEIAQMRDLVLN